MRFKDRTGKNERKSRLYEKVKMNNVTRTSMLFLYDPKVSKRVGNSKLFYW